MGGANGQNKAISSWLDDGSRMTGDCHVRFWEGLGVRFPQATRLYDPEVNNYQLRYPLAIVGSGVELLLPVQQEPEILK